LSERTATGRTFRAIASLAALALVLQTGAVLAAAPAQAETGSSVSGKVHDAAGAAVSATVWLTSIDSGGGASSRSAATDESGVYSFAAIPAGSYTLYFAPRQEHRYDGEWWDDAQTRENARALVLDGSNAVVADAVLGELGTIKGTITGFAGRGLPSVRMQPYLIQPTGEVALPLLVSSSSSGPYQIGSLAPGTYRVVFALAGYHSHEETFTVGLDEVILRDIQLDPLASGDFSTVSAEDLVLTPGRNGISNVRVTVSPRSYADVQALDASACEADSYSWTADLSVTTPRSGAYSATTLSGGGHDSGTVPTEVRDYPAGFILESALVGIYQVRVRVQSTVRYGRCTGSEVEMRSHTWSETLITGLEIRGEFAAAQPVVEGVPARGNTLSVKLGEWSPQPESLSVRWLRDGRTIAGATGSSYLLGEQDVDSQLSVEVLAKATGYLDRTVRSASTDYVSGEPWNLTPVPSIAGTPLTGRTLTAVPGQWDPGTSVTYTWLRDGVAIDQATAKTYRVRSADLGTRISVKATGHKAGAGRVSRTSQASGVVETGSLVPVTPKISGTLATGQRLTVDAGKWAEGTALTYQWRRDGVRIPSATGASYVLGSADQHAGITVRVTGNIDGCAPASATSARTAKILLAHTPTIAGRRTVGSTLSIVRGSWTSKTRFTYQWMRNGKPIKGATASRLRLSKADLGKRISVRVTGRHGGGYATVVLTSPQTNPVGRAGGR
jgi:hypothetical protein